MDRTLTQASKFLSLILRHKPETIHISLDEQGWASVSELIANTQQSDVVFSEELLQEIVAKCNKQRFEFNDDGSKVRCHQGHSLDIELGLEVTKPPEYLYHGTASRFLERIMSEGLRKQKRHHVHLSPDVETATAVGSRYGKPVILKIHAGKMFEDGHTFYVSGNGVWLTDSVAPEYLQRDSV